MSLRRFLLTRSQQNLADILLLCKERGSGGVRRSQGQKDGAYFMGIKSTILAALLLTAGAAPGLALV